jgi:hypothetical protein
MRADQMCWEEYPAHHPPQQNLTVHKQTHTHTTHFLSLTHSFTYAQAGCRLQESPQKDKCSQSTIWFSASKPQKTPVGPQNGQTPPE